METLLNNPMICDPETGTCEIPGRESNTRHQIKGPKTKLIRVIYFTDPICSGCWGIEPQLRKLKLEYGHLLQFEYRMGGLLPDWNYNSGGINKPLDVATHWDEVSKLYQMPIDGDVWLEDPLNSSYPPSIAMKAAQIQNEEKAIDFLRHLRELLFLQKKNITKWKYIEKAALESGLDVGQLKKDYESGEAQYRFQDDLKLAKKLGVRGFPTILFVDDKGNEQLTYGSRSYVQYENVIKSLLPGAEKKTYGKCWDDLYTHFDSLTVKELSILGEIGISVSEMILEDQAKKENLQRITSKNGNIYRKLKG